MRVGLLSWIVANGVVWDLSTERPKKPVGSFLSLGWEKFGLPKVKGFMGRFQRLFSSLLWLCSFALLVGALYSLVLPMGNLGLQCLKLSVFLALKRWLRGGLLELPEVITFLFLSLECRQCIVIGLFLFVGFMMQMMRYSHVSFFFVGKMLQILH